MSILTSDNLIIIFLFENKQQMKNHLNLLGFQYKNI